MTLSTELNRYQGPIAAYLSTRFPDRAAVLAAWRAALADAPTLLPPSPADPARIGKAIELRIGLDLAERLPYQDLLRALPTQEAERIAHDAGFARNPQAPSTPSAGLQPAHWYRRRGPPARAIEALRWRPARRLPSRRDRRLLGECYVLTLVDELRRLSGGLDADKDPILPTALATYREWLQVPEAAAELWVLWQAFVARGRTQLARLGQGVTVAPVLVRRFAEADLVVGRTLVDVKAVAKPAPQLDAWLEQLLAYTLLDHGDHYRLQQVAVYLARQVRLVVWSLEELVTTLTADPAVTLHQLRGEFRAVFEAADLGHPDLGHPAQPHRWIVRDPPSPPASSWGA